MDPPAVRGQGTRRIKSNRVSKSGIVETRRQHIRKHRRRRSEKRAAAAIVHADGVVLAGEAVLGGAAVLVGGARHAGVGAGLAEGAVLVEIVAALADVAPRVGGAVPSAAGHVHLGEVHETGRPGALFPVVAPAVGVVR